MMTRCSYVRFLFFFSSRRRHTRLVSDWSSDVCSSDLVQVRAVIKPQSAPIPGAVLVLPDQRVFVVPGAAAVCPQSNVKELTTLVVVRSEERRVGKECRCRW